ncbi:high affinity copper uptake protein 1-like isoform X2 [Schistocerca serialis cubense]|uniref:high affinity copper uptake protein 1-like isoform X2 n=1 Tax=Schistocerca serialis cubense TaxID=2023355 RepID=UPI00214E02C5|nr:high affinity copper uptake protein 1-like isoform X2 [Schistocerca serialis cubense]
MDHSAHHMMYHDMDHMNHTDDGTSDDMPGHSMMMAMTFHTGYTETVLFDGWKINSVGGLIGSIIGIVFMAALYEGLKYYREYLFWKTYNGLQYRSVSEPGEKNTTSEDNQIVQRNMFSSMHFFQTFLHIVQVVLSYFLMLIFMTYNVWLCLGVVIGAALGYFLFGWKKSVIVDVTEHCH